MKQIYTGLHTQESNKNKTGSHKIHAKTCSIKKVKNINRIKNKKDKENNEKKKKPGHEAYT